ncbi:MAG: metallophosphoesterase family protein [Planctomycetota bacterium]|jgi:diadenosine tetraphosphatase ApaH/serine/threonine PP2A family protein phosphatase
MKRAIISDIHANLDALQAVMDDIDSRGIEEIVCLGDVVGYGPEPAEVIQLVRDRCRVSLMGNHDYALLTVPYGFNRIAAQAINCHRSQLEGACMDHKRCSDHLEWLKERPMKLNDEEEGVLYVHASPRDPITEYVLQSDVAYGPNDKIIEIFEKIDGPCFCGHSHRPGVITSDFKWLSPPEANGLEVTRGKFVINDGSVGQPRDGDPRACYVEWDDGTIAFHRVEYPFRKTMKKITDGGCLHSYCAERLAEGR